MSERDVERLFAGRIPAGGPELDDLTTFFVRLGDAYPKPSVAPYEEAHLAAMRRAAQVVTGEDDAVAERSTAAPKPPRRASTSWTLLTMRTRIAAGGLAVMAALGMAGAGILPAPVQRGVARAAAKIGMRLPGAPEASGVKDLNRGAGRDGAQHRDGWMSGWTGWTRHEAGPGGEKDGSGQGGGGPGAGDDRSDKESKSDQESDDEDDADDFDDEDDSDDADDSDEDDFDDFDDFDDSDDSDDLDEEDEEDPEHGQGSEDQEESESDEIDDDARDASERESELDTETEESD